MKTGQRLRSSLSARISLWTVLFAAIVFIISISVVAFRSRNAVREEAIKGANRVLENTVLRTNYILEDVEDLANNLEWLVLKDLDNPDAMMEYSHNIVQNNTILNGCSISFEPYFYPEKGQYFSAYSNNNGRYVYTMQEGSDNYQYFYLNWYMLPKLLMQPCWTEPYTDQEEGDEATMNLEMNVSYCKPIIGNDGNFIGVISLDISLKWLSETISAVKPYPNAYAFLLGRGGSYLVHPDPQKLFYESFFTPGLVDALTPEQKQLGKDMLEWKEGIRRLEVDGDPSFVIFRPLLTTGWSLAIVCGNLEVELPHMNRTDEIGVLNRAFRYMQVSLRKYIDELTTATAKRERIEGELQIARDIQMGMVPSTFPAFPDRKDIDLYASMSPAKEVGGDLYDYFIKDQNLYFAVADVSGKGVPASLFMAVVRNLFRVVGSAGLPPEEIARQINNTVSEDNEQLMFITMFIGRINLEDGSLSFCNCGHNPPVLLKEKPVFMECEPNVPLGIAPGFQFKGQSIRNFRGTPILLYTDGLNEAENSAHEELGNERLLQSLAANPFKDAEATVQLLQGVVSAHVGDAEQSDDLTLLCIDIK